MQRCNLTGLDRRGGEHASSRDAADYNKKAPSAGKQPTLDSPGGREISLGAFLACLACKRANVPIVVTHHLKMPGHRSLSSISSVFKYRRTRSP